MTPLKVKICGLTRMDDALFACDAGADFIGMIFVPSSPRYVSVERAREIAKSLRARGRIGPQVVGVFRDASLEEMETTAESVGLDLVQLHGAESPEVIERLSLPSIKAFRVHDRLPDARGYGDASWHLFDTFHPTLPGGSGTRFDWSLLADRPTLRPFFLAGGIDPDNVVSAVETVRPDAIDIASGVEETPGVKSRTKIEMLFRNLRLVK